MAEEGTNGWRNPSPRYELTGLRARWWHRHLEYVCPCGHSLRGIVTHHLEPRGFDCAFGPGEHAVMVMSGPGISDLSTDYLFSAITEFSPLEFDEYENRRG